MNFKIKENIIWVGKIDWELRKFHGFELSTNRGSTYNSYLVRDEKNVLIDTVWEPFANEFVENLKKIIDLNEIDYIIANHAEIDHSGALPELLKIIPDTPVYCTANGVKSIKGHYHKDWNFKIVKTGDKLNIGSKEIIFVEMQMLHWPDSLLSYLTGDNIVFSMDAFGQHYATSEMFNDKVNQNELFDEAIKYYANILTPFNKFADKKIKEILNMNLKIEMICPSHGVIWRDNPIQIVNKYSEWCNDYQENRIIIFYDTMWNGTRRMAEAIADGIRTVDNQVILKLFNTAHSDKNDIITEIFRAKAVIAGSPTINKGILSSMAAILEEIKGLGFKKKKAAAFGTFGWSGESIKIIEQLLKESGFEIICDGLKALWNPDETSINSCINFGKEFAQKAKK